MSQVGALLKKSSFLLPCDQPLHGFRVKRVFATGYSQTGGFLVTYINFIRPLATAHLDDGTSVFDGYLIGDGDAFQTPLNQCAAYLPPAVRIIQPRPEPVISVVTQTLVGYNSVVRRADMDSPGDRYRRYEVPGASHLTQRQMDFSPTDEDRARTGVSPAAKNCIEVAQYGISDFPSEYIMNGAFANLDAWVGEGQGYIPPKAHWITLDAVFHLPLLDQYGNAIGGVRTPYLDVPIATYYGESHAADQMSIYMCNLTGYKVPFGASLLRQLYPHDCFWGFFPHNCSYVRKVRKAVDALVHSRFITKDDGERIKSEAQTVGAHLP
jgi:hypothetical protein